MAELLANLEGRTFDLAGWGSVRLVARLGGGRLSEVFRGELSDGRAVAVKIARSDLDERMAANFHSEYETLNTLRAKAKSLVDQKTVREFAASYFPEPICFIPELTAHDGRYSIVILELIQAPKLTALALRSEEHVLDERFGLQTASQYAEMLQVLHAAGYTASDRKIDDIYWRNETTKSLVVLDWNVVGRGQTGISDDLFRFGAFWYEFLVGQTPRFTDVETRRVARPNALPGWNKLSRGTQAILEKALHPVARKRYQTADELKIDVNKHHKRWLMSLDELEQEQELETGLEAAQLLAILDMARCRKSSRAGLDEKIAHLDAAIKAKRLSDFDVLVGDFIKIRDSMLDSSLAEFEAARIEFWDMPAKRAEAARFLLVAKAYAHQNTLPPQALLDALRNLTLEESGQVETTSGEIELALKGDSNPRHELDYLHAELKVQLLVAEAGSLSEGGRYREAAEKFRQAEETRRSTEKTLRESMSETQASEHEWRDLAALFPNLTERMEMAYQLHATVTEPLQLISHAFRLARVGDGAGTERALTIAANWTERPGEVHELLDKLARILPSWPVLQEAILHSPADPGPALEALELWQDLPERKWLLQNESEWHQVVKNTEIHDEIRSIVDDELPGGTRRDLQNVLALRLYTAAAQQDANQLGLACEHLRAWVEHFGCDEAFQEQIDRLLELEQAQVAHYKSCLQEIDPFVKGPPVMQDAPRLQLKELLNAHQAVVTQLEAAVDAGDQSTEQGSLLAETAEPDSALVGQQDPLSDPQSESPSAVAPVPTANGLGSRNDVYANGVGKEEMNQLADVYRALNGARFGDAGQFLARARSAVSDVQGLAQIARLEVVTQACRSAVDSGSSPSKQVVEDLVRAVDAMRVDSLLDAASTRLDWAKQECKALTPRLQLLDEEITIRRSFREVDRCLAEARFVAAARAYPQIKASNGLTIVPKGSKNWQDIEGTFLDRPGKGLLLRPNKVLSELQKESEAVMEDLAQENFEQAVNRLAGPLARAKALEEPEAHRTFHPLAVWLSRVLTSWKDLRAVVTRERPEQVLLALKQAQLTYAYARDVASVASFAGDEERSRGNAERFKSLVNQLDKERQNARTSLVSTSVGWTETDSYDSLEEVDRLIRSVVALWCESDHRQRLLEALRRAAEGQLDLGNRQLSSDSRSSFTSVEQIIRALGFYQSAKLLLAPFEVEDSAVESQGVRERVSQSLTKVLERRETLREFQREIDKAIAKEDYERAIEKAIGAQTQGLQWTGFSIDELKALKEYAALPVPNRSLQAIGYEISSLWAGEV